MKAETIRGELPSWAKSISYGYGNGYGYGFGYGDGDGDGYGDGNGQSSSEGDNPEMDVRKIDPLVSLAWGVFE